MTGLLTLGYGLVAYGACLAALLYLIGFSGNVLVPKSVDVDAMAGALGPWVEAMWVNVVLLSLFALQHSVMARRSFKRWWTRLVPPSIERSTYVIATSLVLAVLFWQWRPLPQPVLWRVEGVAAGLLWGGFALGWALVLFSSFLINHFELFGLQQTFARATGRATPTATFKTPLLYRFVRHPIYLGVLLGVWSIPTMTAGHLLYALGASAYIVVGIWFEERDLIEQFGERYRRYRAEVGMLLPRGNRR
jgi:protein-S-isoprenylcysteine O-methyltransferase Ste14